MTSVHFAIILVLQKRFSFHFRDRSDVVIHGEVLSRVNAKELDVIR